MPTYYRSDLAEIHVTMAGIGLDKESWDMMEGGDPVAEGVTIFPGGMANQKALGGLPKWTPIKFERNWSETLALVYKSIANGAGSIPVEISYVQLNANKTATGMVDTYTGVLTSAERPKYKADESTKAFLVCTMDVDGAVI